MGLHECEVPGESPPSGHGGEGRYQSPSGEHVGWTSHVHLDWPPFSEVGQALGEEDEALAGQPEATQERLVEHEHGG